MKEMTKKVEMMRVAGLSVMLLSFCCYIAHLVAVSKFIISAYYKGIKYNWMIISGVGIIVSGLVSVLLVASILMLSDLGPSKSSESKRKLVDRDLPMVNMLVVAIVLGIGTGYTWYLMYTRPMEILSFAAVYLPVAAVFLFSYFYLVYSVLAVSNLCHSRGDDSSREGIEGADQTLGKMEEAFCDTLDLTVGTTTQISCDGTSELVVDTVLGKGGSIEVISDMRSNDSVKTMY